MLDVTYSPVIQPVVALGRHSHHQCGRMWAVVQSHPQAERWAEHNLNRAGYATYLPTYATKRRDPVLRTITRIVIAPLFPSYLFVRTTPDAPWTPIRYAPGVRHLLMRDGKPDMADAGAVEALQANEALRRTPTTPEALHRPGSACRLAHGPCRGADAVVVSVGPNMAMVSLLMLGALRTVAVPVDWLEARDD